MNDFLTFYMTIFEREIFYDTNIMFHFDLQQMEKTDAKEKDEDKPEFLQVHAKLRAKMAKTD